MLDAVKNILTTESALMNAAVNASKGSDGSGFEMPDYTEVDNDPVRAVESQTKDSGSDDYGQGWQTAKDDDIDPDEYDQDELASAAGQAQQAQSDNTDASGGKSAQQTNAADQNADAQQQAADQQASAKAAESGSQNNTALLEELGGRGRYVQAAAQQAAQTAAVTEESASGEVVSQVAATNTENASETIKQASGNILDVTEDSDPTAADADDLELIKAVENAVQTTGQGADGQTEGGNAQQLTEFTNSSERNIVPPAQKQQQNTSGEMAATNTMADASNQQNMSQFGTQLTDTTAAHSQMGTASADTLSNNNIQSAQQASQTTGTTAAEIQANSAADTQLDVDRLGSRVVQWRNLGLLGNGGSARIRLTPPEMGSVDVSLRTDGQTIQVSMTVESESVRQVLQSNSQRLADALQSNGLQPGRIEVTINTPQNADAQNSGDQGGNQQNGQQGQSSDQDSGQQGQGSFADQQGQNSGAQQQGRQNYSPEQLDVAM